MPTAIPTVEPLLPELFCVDGVGVAKLEVELDTGPVEIDDAGFELRGWIKDRLVDEEENTRELDGVDDGDDVNDDDRVIDVAEPSFDPMLNKLCGPDSGQQLLFR